MTTEPKRKRKRKTKGNELDPVDVHVGENIKNVRLLRGMRQQDLAITSGVTFQSIQKYEKGLNRVSCSRLVEMADALDVPPVMLLGEYADKENKSVSDLSELLDGRLMKVIRRYRYMNDEQKRHLLQTAELMPPAID